MGVHGKEVLRTLELSTIQLHGILLFSIVSILCFRPTTCLGKLAGNETDRLALLEFKSRIRGDPIGVLSSWNDSVHFCSWQGVACSNLHHQRVVTLNLSGLSLSGTISPYVGNLSFLRFINLVQNQFSGEIPHEVGRLFRLRHLNLDNNTLGGEIPRNISYCKQLEVLGLTGNGLVGKIPDDLGSLNKLVFLGLSGNNLTGEIPRSFGNLSSLEEIIIAYNNLKGKIPDELGKLSRLNFFVIGVNNFVGTIPLEMYNISSLTVITTAGNNLHGNLPTTIGLTLPNLVDLYIGGNKFDGTIPASLINASFLRSLDISYNSFVGQVPDNLGVLKDLYSVDVGGNFLGSNTSEDLRFITSLSNCSNLRVLTMEANNFGGTLPRTVANMSINLEILYMGGNQILGRIPEDLANLVNLNVIAMEANKFSGTIPTSFGKFPNLQVLSLAGNLLSGEIPPSIGNLSKLYELDLEYNQLEGNITSSLGKCQRLEILDISANKLVGSVPPQIIGLSSLSIVLNLSQNSLTGSLPLEVGNLKIITALDVSENQLSGKIPDSIGECSSLEILNLQGNSLQGPIPSSITSLRGLHSLDLSRNNLSGNVPRELEKIKGLLYLNLSFNNLEGEVPIKGVFSNKSAVSLVGNDNLCGGIIELHLPKCVVTRKRSSHVIILVSIIISSIVVFVATISLCIFYRKKSKRNPTSESPFLVEKLPHVSYKELVDATQGFSSDFLIGQGSFGTVYRGRLQLYEGRLVAIKVLNLQQQGASKSFDAECKSLRNIRHRNLVKILTYCSIPNFRGNEFKALVFDYMENGSLEMWLHPDSDIESSQPRSLNLLQRLCIAIDVASALHYLHDDCDTQIIHCDLKPSNILLDEDMVAHVGDFGLARLMSKSTSVSSHNQTSSIGIKGSIGYMAPEYGLGSEATTKGDVYSFGIILLEMFTGKRPTDEAFTDTTFNLHNFVKAALPEQVMQIMDPRLLTGTRQQLARTSAATQEMNSVGQVVDEISRQGTDNVQICILSLLTIGLTCSSEVPRDRMNMRDVLRELNHSKDAFLRTGGGGGNATGRDRRIRG